MDLVFTIIFENENTFTKLNKRQCKNLMAVSPSMCMKNANITNAFIRYQVEYIYDSLNFNVKDDSNVIANITNEEVKAGVMNLMIAEYKELVFKKISYPDLFNYIDSHYMSHLKSLIPRVMLAAHKHNPHHHIFQNDYRYYMFYRHYQKKGKNILDYYKED